MLDDFDSTFELGFLFVGGFDAACSPTTPLRSTIYPLQVVALPKDASIEAINVLAAGWFFCWNLFENAMKLIDESFGLCDRDSLWSKRS